MSTKIKTKLKTKIINGILHADIDTLCSHPLNDEWQDNEYDTKHIIDTYESGVGLLHPPSVLTKTVNDLIAGTIMSGHTRVFSQINI